VKYVKKFELIIANGVFLLVVVRLTGMPYILFIRNPQPQHKGEKQEK
jgi:hypothetical protein